MTRRKSFDVIHHHPHRLSVPQDSTEWARTIEVLNGRISTLENHHGPSGGENHILQDQLHDMNRELESLKVEVQLLRMKYYDGGGKLCERMAEYVTSITGLKETVGSKIYWQRFVWAIIFCFGIALTIYFVVATSLEYFEERTLTKVKLNSRDPYRYPPIVFCHEAWFDAYKAKKLGFTTDAVKYSLGYWRTNKGVHIEDPQRAREEFQEAYAKREFRSLFEYFEAISVDLEPLESEDEFYNTTKASYFLREGEQRAQKVFLPYVAFCHSFTIPSVDGRLGVLQEPERIYLKYEDRTGGVLDASRNWMIFTSTDPRAIYSWPLTIEPFSQHSLAVEQQQLVSFNSDESPCIVGETQDNISSMYTSSTCMIECQNRVFTDKMHCQLYWLSTTNTSRGHPDKYCNYFNSERDANGDVIDFTQARVGVADEQKEECRKQCAHGCGRDIFTIQSMGNEHFMLDYRAHSEIDDAQRRQSNTTLTAVYFLHRAMQNGGVLMVTEVSSYSFIQLVSNIGGTLGLFVGGTMMTLVQFTMFIVDYFTGRAKESTEKVFVKKLTA